MISVPLEITEVYFSRPHQSWLVMLKCPDNLTSDFLAQCPTELDAITFAVKYEDGAVICVDAECGKCIVCKHTH